MSGNEISVHTWSHTVSTFFFLSLFLSSFFFPFYLIISLFFFIQHLTTQTNAQIVAELGWTRKAIKSILGVSPTTMRPPFGDIGHYHFIYLFICHLPVCSRQSFFIYLL